jgi:hypothetical protein
MGKKDELMDDTVLAYEQSTGSLPDTRDYVAIENAVSGYIAEQEATSNEGQSNS